MKRSLPKTHCMAPWLSLSVDVDGTSRPCCKLQLHKTSKDFGTLKTHSLAELWNSTGMIQLRREFMMGQTPPECSHCWDEEKGKVRSLRQEFLEHRMEKVDVEFNRLTPEAPRILDLKLSNLCNLKCRICSPRVSSLYLKEQMQFEPGVETEKERDYLQSNKITDSKENLETFKSWLPHLEHVEMFGGEPLISRENRDIERLMIESGNAHKISLLYNTNVTVFNEELVKVWDQFEKVILCLSLDDTGPRQEYERFPSKWPVLEQNLQKFSALQSAKIDVVLVCSVSNFNIWYLPEYVQWVRENTPNLSIRFNIVHGDIEMCITNLPESLKRKVDTKLKAMKLDSLDPVLKFMKSKSCESFLWKKFLSRTIIMDFRRKQSFGQTFPEYFDMIMDPALITELSPVIPAARTPKSRPKTQEKFS